MSISRCCLIVLRAALITEYLLTSARADEPEAKGKPDYKYALIGAATGLFLSAVFIVLNCCIISKHEHNYSTDHRRGSSFQAVSANGNPSGVGVQ